MVGHWTRIVDNHQSLLHKIAGRVSKTTCLVCFSNARSFSMAARRASLFVCDPHVSSEFNLVVVYSIQQSIENHTFARSRISGSC